MARRETEVAPIKSRTRTSLVSTFLVSSRIFIKRLKTIEASADDNDEDAWSEYQGLVCSVIFQSAAALECEGMEICHHGVASIGGLNDAPAYKAGDNVLHKRRRSLDDMRPVERFDEILKVHQKPPFIKSDQIYADAELLVKLRNGTIHYESKWGPKPRPHGGWPAALQAKGFAPPARGSEEFRRNLGFFPDTALSRECAFWAQQTTVLFLQDVYHRLGVADRLAPYASRLHD